MLVSLLQIILTLYVCVIVLCAYRHVRGAIVRVKALPLQNSRMIFTLPAEVFARHFYTLNIPKSLILDWVEHRGKPEAFLVPLCLFLEDRVSIVVLWLSGKPEIDIISAAFVLCSLSLSAKFCVALNLLFCNLASTRTIVSKSFRDLMLGSKVYSNLYLWWKSWIWSMFYKTKISQNDPMTAAMNCSSFFRYFSSLACVLHRSILD